MIGPHQYSLLRGLACPYQPGIVEKEDCGRLQLKIDCETSDKKPLRQSQVR